MIVYMPDPMELFPSTNEDKKITLKLSSGGYVIAEPCEYNKLRIINVCSTDLSDYMNSNLQPGNILSMQVQLENQKPG